jgi:integrase
MDLHEVNVARYDAKEGLNHSLIFRRGKWNVSVNAPEAVAFLYADGRKRYSTGTADKSLAQRRIPQILARADAEFTADHRKLDPFVEALRHIFVRHGINIDDWYQRGSLEIDLRGDATWLWQVTGGKFELRPEDVAHPLRGSLGRWKLPKPSEEEQSELDHARTSALDGTSSSFSVINGPLVVGSRSEESFWDEYFEEYTITSRIGFAVIATMLGGEVLSSSLIYLSDEERTEIRTLMEPKKPDIKLLVQFLKDPDFSSTPLGRVWSEEPDLDRSPVVKVSSATTPLYSDLIEQYLKDRSAEPAKQHSQRIKACQRVLHYLGDKPIDQYDNIHAAEMAKLMHEERFSNAQINKMITYGRGLFLYAMKTRNPMTGKSYLKSNPWVDLDLAEYGVPQRGWVPFTKEELGELFAVAMPRQEYLLFSILITTGMRLDEAALMTWERVTVQEGLPSFSLVPHDVPDGEELKVKNTGSMRYVPVPTVIQPLLDRKSVGRLFDYRIDKDGKAENAASKALMKYIREITAHDRKAVHSLRGNFKDLCRSRNIHKELHDFLTGHGQGDVGGDDYGVGHDLPTRLVALDSIEHPWIEKTINSYLV